MMKMIAMFALMLGVFAVTAPRVSAAPFGAIGKNPQIVASYLNPMSDHAIIGIDGSPDVMHFYGRDLVMQAGNSGNFQQWFENDTIGYHSVWQHVGSSTSCANGWVLVENANHQTNGNTWGDYLVDGNYCVHTNAYGVGASN